MTRPLMSTLLVGALALAQTVQLSGAAESESVHSSLGTDPYQQDMAHYSRDCNVVDGKVVECFQRPSAPGAIRVGCVGDSITAVGHTS